MLVLGFFSGLLIGSFLNVVIHRLPRGETVVFGRSYCPKCKTVLAWYDLIPLFSYVILRGRCRYCRERISLRYPLVEFLTGAVFAALFFRLGFSLVLFKYLCLASILIAASFIDTEYYLIPNRLIFTALVIGGGFLLSNIEITIGSGLLGALSAGGLLLLLNIVSRGNVGGGDIKLAAVLGLFLGWPLGFLAVLLGLFLAGTVGFFLLAARIKGRKDPLPLAPFLSAGACIAFFGGPSILYWYLSRFWIG
ncbi:type 4 prepilin peptidase 1 Aspartic peptidase. MEROPS family A24A [Thermanaeromonas toyohensis ToBE]|uniref:Type 4 prepilin peptidase 1 Aspartic peptidase. MEROPS family A24A n=1 Tax=Thermanaeromonas toyohensis ToBE TaxID=698762 RepID=A0A1W1VZ51_9FIRM|nr:A24 family peptidase [Thermanaeromonas toyohensis]SMB98616.1 type 4 prepilin peptidase 1 Aspartic peptidase. MEROPS family A24A [Thermanaeromonas toyohensis ToBE]